MVQSTPLELVDGVTGELGKKRQIVAGINNERFLRPARELIEIGHGADRAPELAQAVEIDMRLDAFANVARGLAVPDDVRHVG